MIFRNAIGCCLFPSFVSPLTRPTMNSINQTPSKKATATQHLYESGNDYPNKSMKKSFSALGRWRIRLHRLQNRYACPNLTSLSITNEWTWELTQEIFLLPSHVASELWLRPETDRYTHGHTEYTNCERRPTWCALQNQICKVYKHVIVISSRRPSDSLKTKMRKSQSRWLCIHRGEMRPLVLWKMLFTMQTFEWFLVEL